MATRKGSSKKGSSKKSTGKKSAKKSAKKGGALAAPSFPINLRCIAACVERYNRCLQKGVPQATCLKRLGRNIQNCALGIFPTSEDDG
jgi:hypothetical protein